MRHRPLVFIFAGLAAMLSCNPVTKSDPETTITSVTVAFSGLGCEAPCPFMATRVDSSLGTQYYGGPYARVLGSYTGKMAPATWDSIQRRFGKFVTVGLDPLDHDATDHPIVELVIHSGSPDKKTVFREDTGKMSDADLKTLYWFIELPHALQLVKVDSLEFETTVQIPE